MIMKDDLHRLSPSSDLADVGKQGSAGRLDNAASPKQRASPRSSSTRRQTQAPMRRRSSMGSGVPAEDVIKNERRTSRQSSSESLDSSGSLHRSRKFKRRSSTGSGDNNNSLDGTGSLHRSKTSSRRSSTGAGGENLDGVGSSHSKRRFKRRSSLDSTSSRDTSLDGGGGSVHKGKAKRRSSTGSGAMNLDEMVTTTKPSGEKDNNKTSRRKKAERRSSTGSTNHDFVLPNEADGDTVNKNATIAKQPSKQSSSRSKSNGRSSSRRRPRSSKSVGRSVSQPVLRGYDEGAGDDSATLGSIPETNDLDPEQARSAPRRAQSASAAIPPQRQEAEAAAASSAAALAAVQFTIAVDTPKTHGKRINIVPGIEMVDEEDEENEAPAGVVGEKAASASESAQDESTRSRSTRKKKARDWSFRSVRSIDSRTVGPDGEIIQQPPVAPKRFKKRNVLSAISSPGGLPVAPSTESVSGNSLRSSSGHARSVASSPRRGTGGGDQQQDGTGEYALHLSPQGDDNDDDSFFNDGGTHSNHSSYSDMSGDNALANAVFAELEMDGVSIGTSGSEERKNWNWLQKSDSIKRGETNNKKAFAAAGPPPKPPMRRESGELGEDDSGVKLREHLQKSLIRAKSAEVGQLMKITPMRRKSAESIGSNDTGSDGSDLRPYHRPLLPSQKLLVQQAGRLMMPQSPAQSNPESSTRTASTMAGDESIDNSHHLPESNLEEQNWMQKNDNSSDESDSSYSSSGSDYSESEEEQDEEAYVREYVERMQQQRRQKPKAGESEAGTPNDEQSTSVDDSTESDERDIKWKPPAYPDKDEESIQLYMPRGYVVSKAERVAQMLEEMKRIEPSTPGAVENDCEATDGVTPKASNLSGNLAKMVLAMAPTRGFEGLENSFTDLHINVSLQDSVAGSSLSASSIGSDDNSVVARQTQARRRAAMMAAFKSTSDSQASSIRSSFNQSLTSINEDQELSGDQLEMLELGSKKIPFRLIRGSSSISIGSTISNLSHGSSIQSIQSGGPDSMLEEFDGSGDEDKSPPGLRPGRGLGSIGGKHHPAPPLFVLAEEPGKPLRPAPEIRKPLRAPSLTGNLVNAADEEKMPELNDLEEEDVRRHRSKRRSARKQKRRAIRQQQQQGSNNSSGNSASDNVNRLLFRAKAMAS